MKIKTTTLINLSGMHTLYSSGDNVGWHPVRKTDDTGEVGLIGHTTYCKEEIGAQCVRQAYNRFVVALPGTMDDEALTKLADYIEKKEKDVSIKRTVISRVKSRPKWLLITHSPRWSRNSVAHSVLTTWLRVAIGNHFKEEMETVAGKDSAHMEECWWLLNRLTKHTMRIFGTQQHDRYDFGMVSFTARLKTGDFWQGNAEEPSSYDFDDEDEFDEAYSNWEETQGEHIGLGDLDKPLQNEHGYAKLLKLHKGAK